MDPFVGQIMTFAGTYAPEGWLLCDGSTQPISNYDVLYAVIGNSFGGDGSSTFGLPDLRGRIAIGMGQGAGLPSYNIGDQGGETSVALTNNTMPTHSHQASFSGSATLSVALSPGTSQVPAAGLLPSAINTATVDASLGGAQDIYTYGLPNALVQMQAVNMAGVTVGVSLTGNGYPHDNMSPYVAMTYCICWSGIFPTRP